MLSFTRVLFVLIVAATSLAHGERQRTWIVLRDKGPGTDTVFRAGSPLYNRAAATLSPRAAARRAKVRPADALFNYDDLPLYQAYLDTLARYGVRPIYRLKWFNAVTDSLDDSMRTVVQSLPFVKSVSLVKRLHQTDRDRESRVPVPQGPWVVEPYNPDDTLDYGASYPQDAQIGLAAMHALGITGHDVILGSLDAGFRWKVHEATQGAHVISEYDFVWHDSSTANDSLDAPNQDGHGTLTFSEISGFAPGHLIGGAYNASFVLAKTEFVPSETHTEEDNYAAALEWMDSIGVDVTTSSLGYSTFDSGQVSYTYADMNGHTTVVARAVEKAVACGMCCVTAAGNSGDAAWNYIISPADADSVIAVGAVDSNGVLANFSSRGPTSDGRIKPDVCARGVLTRGTSTSPGLYVAAYGTSLSTPLVSSGVALLLSAFPELTPMQVRDALRNTASQATHPDTAYGWGTIDLLAAARSIGTVISNPPRVFSNTSGSAKILAGVVAPAARTIDSVVVAYSRGGAAARVAMPQQCYADYYAATIDGLAPGTNVPYAIYAYLNDGSVARSPRAADSYYTFTVGDTTPFPQSPLGIAGACARVPSSPVLLAPYPNPFRDVSTVTIGTPFPQTVTLELFDVLGRQVGTVFHGTLAGTRTVTWSAPQLASGAYFLRMTAGESVQSVLVGKKN